MSLPRRSSDALLFESTELLREYRRCITQLQALRKELPASTAHATSAILMSEPSSIDDIEIMDKGYINLRMLLGRRNELEDGLFSESHPDLIPLPK